jgi:hypothetical protein
VTQAAQAWLGAGAGDSRARPHHGEPARERRDQAPGRAMNGTSGQRRTDVGPPGHCLRSEGAAGAVAPEATMTSVLPFSPEMDVNGQLWEGTAKAAGKSPSSAGAIGSRCSGRAVSCVAEAFGGGALMRWHPDASPCLTPHLSIPSRHPRGLRSSTSPSIRLVSSYRSSLAVRRGRIRACCRLQAEYPARSRTADFRSLACSIYDRRSLGAPLVMRRS